ncbi:hypothetical protein WMY93_015315 [Mugilogobius chulae]|uniref:Acid sphingomyelinase-like phosphodiesterase n=1 Tax=Mugilogobius chulae TaxID=88201 RepID=A0AAW0NW82_9GOBI
MAEAEKVSAHSAQRHLSPGSLPAQRHLSPAFSRAEAPVPGLSPRSEAPVPGAQSQTRPGAEPGLNQSQDQRTRTRTKTRSSRTRTRTRTMWLMVLLCSVAPLTAAPMSKHHSGAGRMWHITDLHLDPTFHLDPDPAHVCSSSKGAAALAPGPFGDYLCDAPYRLLLSALDTLGRMVKEDDFVIWTGDSPPHVPPAELSTDLVIQILANLTLTIQDKLPKVQVFPAVGNHDYWPQDQMPDSPNDIYSAAARLWSPWLQEGALQTFVKGGFYSQLLRPGLRIVSLNTILYYGPNAATLNSSDPAGQFQWLQGTLEGAERNQEQVYVIAHVPVGFLPFVRNTTAMRREHNERLSAMFVRFSHVIKGQFYGHTHRDSLMVLRDQSGPVAVLPEPDRSQLQQRAQWRLEYVLTEAFALKDLSPASLLSLASDLLPPSSKAFLTYFNHFNVEFNPRLSCEGRCKVDQVCAVLNVAQSGYERCLGLQGHG